MVQNKTHTTSFTFVNKKIHTTSFTFENKKNRLLLTVFWGLRHPKKTHGTPLRMAILDIGHEQWMAVEVESFVRIVKYYY